MASKNRKTRASGGARSGARGGSRGGASDDASGGAGSGDRGGSRDDAGGGVRNSAGGGMRGGGARDDAGGGVRGGAGDDGAAPGAAGRASFWRRNRRELTFLVLFVALLGGSFTLVSVNWVNDHLIEPFTAGVARASGAALSLLGQQVARHGTVIESRRFAVNIRNGCNGVEAMLIFLAAVLAFPAAWRSRLAGLALGIAAIQVINLVRVVALFLTGAYWPRLFAASHTVIWQSIVILCSVLLWVYWASRFAGTAEPAA